MYNLTSPADIRPVYDRGGMRFDLAVTDPQDEWSTTGQRRFQYCAAFGSPIHYRQHYHYEIMFPDEFNESAHRFSLQYWKHKNSSEPHSGPVALTVDGDSFYYLFRTMPTGVDLNERRSQPVVIQRNKWYTLDIEAIWGPRVVPKDWSPYTKIWCNNQLICDDHQANCYDIDGDLADRFGIYIWNWDDLKTQTIFYRI